MASSAEAPEPEPERGRGRRPGKADTRSTVLAAARREFSAQGYAAASVRGIARAAGVDPALVHHYFGTKEQVFVAAMKLPFSPASVLPGLLEGPREELGERVVRFFLSAWSQPATRNAFLGLLRSAMTHEAAAAMLRGFITEALLGRMTAALGLGDDRLRVTAAASQLMGMGVLRYVVKVEPMASASEDDLVALVGPTIQRYLVP